MLPQRNTRADVLGCVTAVFRDHETVVDDMLKRGFMAYTEQCVNSTVRLLPHYTHWILYVIQHERLSTKSVGKGREFSLHLRYVQA